MCLDGVGANVASISLYLLYFSFISGKSETHSKSPIKLKVDLPFFPFEDCQELYLPQNKKIDETQVHTKRGCFD